MSVISGADYLSIATAYANAYDKLISTISYYYEPVTTIVLLDDVVPTIDLLSTMYNAYQVNEARVKSKGFYEAAVRSLNNHVILQSTQKDLNDYLADEVLPLGGVPSSWKTMCDAIGYTIEASNVAP